MLKKLEEQRVPTVFKPQTECNIVVNLVSTHVIGL